MLSNYVKIAWRNLINEKSYGLINILGLAIGLACCFLIIRYAQFELNYDKFHDKADRLYRAVYVHDSPDQTIRLAQTPVPLAGALKSNLADVEEVSRVHKVQSVIRQGENLSEQEVLIADNSFFELFSFAILQGQKKEVLNNPGDLLLSERAAKRYFDGQNPIGKPMQLRIYGEYHDFTVAAVVEDPPSNSSIQFEVIIPFERYASIREIDGGRDNWRTLLNRTYLLLHPGSVENNAERVINNYLKVSTELENIQIDLQPITHIHHATRVQAGLEPTSNPLYAYILVGIAFFVLLIACINFTTLAVGRSARRASEVGMRKTLGATRAQIIRQFISETVIVVVIALLLALFLSEWTLPYFNNLVGEDLTLSFFANSEIGFTLILMIILVTLLGGGYPAFYLSRFQPVKVLKGRWSSGGNHYLMYSLIAVQFTISVVLIVTTMLMNRQMDLIMNKDLGFGSEQVVRLQVPNKEGKEVLGRLKSTLPTYSDIRLISGSWQKIPTKPWISNGVPITYKDKEARGYVINGGSDLVETLQLELKEGRGFGDIDPDNPPNKVIVNEKLVEAMGWEEPIGKQFSMVFSFQDAEVVGVVEDFHYLSLHEPIAPLAIYPETPFISNIYIRTAPTNLENTLQVIEEEWEKAAPGLPFQFSFLNEEVASQYKNDRRWQSIIQFASFLAILIACLGLFGLSTLASARRSKEVGIRKVLGATIPVIVKLLSTDFLKPVIVGFLVAVPIAYFVANRWLETFAYRADIGIYLFLMAGAITMFVALATVSWQAIRAATANPVESLRTE